MQDDGGNEHARRLGFRVRVLREEQQMSVSRLSWRAGIAMARLLDLEAGYQACSYDDLRRLAAALQVPLVLLLAPSDPRHGVPAPLDLVYALLRMPPPLLEALVRLIDDTGKLAQGRCVYR